MAWPVMFMVMMTVGVFVLMPSVTASTLAVPAFRFILTA